MLPVRLPVSVTVHSSALEKASTRSVMRRVSSWVRIFMCGPRLADLASGVDDVDAVEARGTGAVRHGADLRRLAFAVEEGAAHAPVAVVADGAAGVPEFLGVRLVGHV